MKKTITILTILLSANLTAAEISTDKPTIPFFDWGACPFECCTYKEWTAKRDVNIYKDRSGKSEISFRVKSGQSVRGLTGVVITTAYGITKISKPLQIGYTADSKTPQLSLKAGDIVYTLHYEGEGNDVFWYKGKTYSDQIAIPDNAWGAPPNSETVKIISRPQTEWWAQVQDKDGNLGWTKETDAFAHIDACE